MPFYSFYPFDLFSLLPIETQLRLSHLQYFPRTSQAPTLNHHHHLLTFVSSNQSAMCFHLFPLLPTEIRLQIWIMTLPDSRRFIQPASGRRVVQNWASTDPIALRVNRESRETALGYYSARDLALLKRHEATYNIRNPAYINFTKDVISFLIPRDIERFYGYAKLRFTSISKQEMHCVKRVETIVCIPSKAGFPRYLDSLEELKDAISSFLDGIHIFPNIRFIYIGIYFQRIGYEIKEEFDRQSGLPPVVPPISGAIEEARYVGQRGLETLEGQDKLRGKPVLVIKRVYEYPPRLSVW
jgi:2EXR family